MDAGSSEGAAGHDPKNKLLVAGGNSNQPFYSTPTPKFISLCCITEWQVQHL